MYLHGCYIAAVVINQNNHQNTSAYVSCKQVTIPQYVSTHSWSFAYRRNTVIPIKIVAIFWVQNYYVYSTVIHKSWYPLDKLGNIWGDDPPKITCCYYFRVIKSDTISNNGYKIKVKKSVLNVHCTFTWGKLCRMKPHVLLLTCHPCNIYGSKTCSHGCIVVSVYCHETNPHPAVWNPHSSLEQEKESLQMFCMCPLLEHNHSAITIQIQLLDAAYSAQKPECQTLCMFYIKYWMGFMVERNNITDWSAVAEMFVDIT